MRSCTPSSKSGQTFRYDLVFPWNEPPGLYWYHPHAHGLVEAALQGGASGAIVVDGIQKLAPAVAGLRQQILVIRDQNVAGNPTPGGAVPSWDLSVNFVPIAYPKEVPSIIQMRSGRNELWRVVNASADTQLDERWPIFRPFPPALPLQTKMTPAYPPRRDGVGPNGSGAS
jgi:FtsP/CotA-like multicopper oxidase with cupredoxin domain